MSVEARHVNRRWLWAGAAVILVVVFFSVRALTRDRLPVRVSVVSRQPLASTVSTNGRVEPVANYEVHSPISTTVKAVYVQPGDHVKAGQLLLSLDDVQARAQLASAESGVKTAQSAMDVVLHNGTLEQRQATAADLKRSELSRDHARQSLDALIKLQAGGAASASEVAAARQQLSVAEAGLQAIEASANGRYSPDQVAQARASLADAEAHLAAARDVMRQTEVRAPISGTVYSIDTGPTEYAESGKLLLEIADLSRVRVRAYFDEPEIGKLKAGQPILIKWDAKPGMQWKGEIERTPVSVITYGTRNVGVVLIRVEDADDALLPDTNVTVTVTTSSQSDALSVPREALYSESGEPYVFKVDGDELHRTPVTTGTINLTQVAILSGLNPGDRVATGTTNGQPLQEGLPIEVVQ